MIKLSKSATIVALIAGVVAGICPGTPIVAQAQAQPAIAFDQIDRLLLEGATPPPVDSFAADAATLAALPPLTSGIPSSGDRSQSIGMTLVSTALGFIPFVGGLIAGVASQEASAAQQAAQARATAEHQAAVKRFISAGSLSHFAFYHGWLRSEHAGRDVTIVKPEQGLTIFLDLPQKTARIVDTRNTETITVDTQEPVLPQIVGEPVTERLPEAMIGGLPARGYRTTATLELMQGLGWCGRGSHSVVQIEYVTDTADPQPDTAVPAAQGLADACRPTSTASYREPGHLVVYRATSIEPGTPNGVSVVFERANIHALDAGSAPLFSIPSDFTQEH